MVSFCKIVPLGPDPFGIIFLYLQYDSVFELEGGYGAARG
jgi:hypothetical protein